MDNKKIDNAMLNFAIQPISDIVPVSEIISKARVRIFYTGLNRNRTYISEEFAEKLLATLPYTPVGGLWSETAEDFTDHGGLMPEDRAKFSAFGVVPENPNVQWENHLDQDGVLRRYACCDVLLWTARYQAAREIPGKAQSMELYFDSVQGEWKRDGAIEYFEFTDGRFFGLTALGEDVEPCFEGAAFYNLDESSKDFFKELKNYTLSATNELIGGQEEMDTENKQDTPVVETDEETTEKEENVVEEADENAVTETAEEVVDPEETVEKADEEAPATENAVEETEEVEGTETVEDAEETPADADGEKVEEEDAATEEATESENNEFSAEQFELLNSQIADLQEKVSLYEKQIEELTEYKKATELAKKQGLIEKYSTILGEEEAENFTNKIADYTYESLESAISLSIVKSHEEVLFSKGEIAETVTDVETHYSGAEGILAKYNN